VNGISPDNPLQAPPDASPVRRSAGRAQAHGSSLPKRNPAGRGEKTRDGAGPFVGRHTVFVLAVDGKALAPTTPTNYPICAVGWEDVRFNHRAHPWGSIFSTVEVGKARIRAFFAQTGAEVFMYRAYQTREIRKKYAYRKVRVKTADRFEAHCSDALALACEAGTEARVEPGPFLVVDDTYRPVRRQLHDSKPAPGGLRAVYSRGTVFGLRKGILIGTIRGKVGRLCGENLGGYRYYDEAGKRQTARRLAWVRACFVVRAGRPHGAAR
jgi:hypothetical protein